MLVLGWNRSQECPRLRRLGVFKVNLGELAELTTIDELITDRLAACLGVDSFNLCRDGFGVEHGIFSCRAPSPRQVQSAYRCKLFQRKTIGTAATPRSQCGFHLTYGEGAHRPVETFQRQLAGGFHLGLGLDRRMHFAVDQPVPRP